MHRLTIFAAAWLFGCVAHGDGVTEILPRKGACGPVAARHILRHFGHDTSLEELVAEIKPEPSEGCSLKTLQDALHRRKLFSVALHIGPGVRIRESWPHPVIIHIDNGAAEPDHFAIQLPSASADRVALDLGEPHGATEYSRLDAARLRSGAVLLVDDAPITDVSRIVSHPAMSRVAIISLWVGLCLAGMSAAALLRQKAAALRVPLLTR